MVTASLRFLCTRFLTVAITPIFEEPFLGHLSGPSLPGISISISISVCVCVCVYRFPNVGGYVLARADSI